MKKIMLYILFIHLSLSTEAQVFNNVYNNFDSIYTLNGFNEYYHEAFDFINIKGNKIFVSGSSTSPGGIFNGSIQTLINEISFNGDSINQRIFFLDTFKFANASYSFFIDDKQFLTGYVHKFYSSNNFERIAVIASVDTNYNVLSYTLFDYGDETSFFRHISHFGYTYLMGYSDVDTSNNTNFDIFITKLNNLGQPVDTFQLGGFDYDFPREIISLSNGNILISGYTLSFGAGDEDLYLLEIDTLGSIVWQQTYGYPSSDLVNSIKSAFVSENKEIYLCGSTELMTGDRAAWLIKTDSLGNQIWEKKFNRGTSFEGFINIEIARDGNIIVTGGTRDYSISPSPPLAWLMKIDQDGNQIWERFIRKYNDLSDTYVQNLIQDSFGSIYLSGYITGNSTMTNGVFHRNDAWLSKTDSCGFTVGAEPQALFTIDSVVGAQVYISNLSEEYCNALLFIENSANGLIDTVNIYAYSQFTNGNNPEQMVYTVSDTGSYLFQLFTYAGDGVDSFSSSILISDTSTSILEVNRQNISFTIFPNPSSSYFILQLNTNEFTTVNTGNLLGKIYTLTGQEVHTFQIENKQLQQKIELPELVNGVYTLKIHSVNNDFSGVKRLMIVK